MGSKYTSQSISGYNSSAPADDGTQNDANKVKWSTIKTKLGDPVKTLAEAMNTALVTALDTSARSITGNDSATAADNGKVIEIGSTVTAALTVTLADAATMGAGYMVTVFNAGSGVATVATSGSDTINGQASISLPAKTGATVRVNAAANGYVAPDATSTSTSYVPTGSVTAYAGTAAPTGWLICDGAAVSRSTYAALFAVLGTAYGSGNGTTTFNLPDLRGRAVFGKDDMGGTAASRITSAGSGITGTTLGANGGAETVTLTTAQIPAHNHTVNATLNTSVNSGAHAYASNLSGATGTATDVTTNTGGGGAHQNMPPAIVLNYIVKM